MHVKVLHAQVLQVITKLLYKVIPETIPGFRGASMTNLPEVEIVPELLQQNRTQVKHQINHKFVQPEEATLLPTHELPIIHDHPITVIQHTPGRQIQQPDQAVLPEGHNPAMFLTPKVEITIRTIQDPHQEDLHRVHPDRPTAIHPAVHQAHPVDRPVQEAIHQADHPVQVVAQVEVQAAVQVEAQADLQVEDQPEVHADKRNL